MQTANFFHDGGLVAHGLENFQWRGVCSAWFDPKGVLIDAEHKPGGFGTPPKPVKKDGPLWKLLQNRYYPSSILAKRSPPAV